MVVLNSFLSYLLLFVILVAIAFVATKLGIAWAKKSNAKNPEAKTDENKTAKE